MASIPRIMAKTMKVVLHWTSANGLTARNIIYFLANQANTTQDPENLVALANAVHGQASPATGMQRAKSHWAGQWSLSSVVAWDNSGVTEEVHPSDLPAIQGTGSTTLPPSCAVALSWDINSHYRGGHPRLYLPGVPSSALVQPDLAKLDDTWATQLHGEVTSMLGDWIDIPMPATSDVANFVVIRFQGKTGTFPAAFPVQGVKVHERLDSQRRRSGKEAAYGTIT